VRVRIVKTPTGKFGVQVVSRYGKNFIFHKQIGSAKNEKEKQKLITEANKYISSHNPQQDLFDDKGTFSRLGEIEITKSQPLFLYRILCGAYRFLGFDNFPDPVIKDLIVTRVYKPVSKLEIADILRDEFGRSYSLKTVYRHLKTAVDNNLKDSFQEALINFAKNSLNDSLRLVFYDVTTLAFDSQIRAGLKDFGFSKDHRFHDVQIVIGLVVNRDGFPLYFDVFNGRTFEGKTFIPIVEKIKTLLNSPDLTVIADAAMISRLNIEELNKRHIGFIVGARLGSLSKQVQEIISGEVLGIDKAITTVNYLNHRLICQYLNSRAAKDRSDREKQLEKARRIVSAPSKITGRFKYVETVNGKYGVNEALVQKAKLLEGIKGYLTNTNLDEQTIIDRYHDLWRIERSFRITKSDLEARPIFHQLDKTIISHLIIVFAGLAIARYLELKTDLPIKKVIKIAKKVLTHKVAISKTGESALIETKITDPILCGQLDKLRDLEYQMS
jgi:transposase